MVIEPPQDHWLPGFNFNVEERDEKGPHFEALAICRSLALAHAPFGLAVEEKPVALIWTERRSVRAPRCRVIERVIDLRNGRLRVTWHNGCRAHQEIAACARAYSKKIGA